MLPPPPPSSDFEYLAASFAVGLGDYFLYRCVPAFLASSFVSGTALMLICLMSLRWLVVAEFAFQIVEHGTY